jgi:4-hydroxy-tetrahydrodipicolinate synthase
MRPPMPRPRQIEIDTIYELLKNLGLSVIDKRETAIEKLEAVSA